MVKPLSELEKSLGYKFLNLGLLQQALHHRSAGLPSNERLEFLGDSILNFIIADFLYHRYPECEEGELSRLRSNLVQGKMLTELSLEFSVGDYIQLGAGERKSGGTKRTSILADALEAIIGALYLDAGMKPCKLLILKWYATRFAKIEIGEQKDPKTKLQEFLQAHKLPLPQYEIIKTEGAPHAQVFHIRCQVIGLDKTTFGVGGSRRQAEQDAAEKFLVDLNLKIIKNEK